MGDAELIKPLPPFQTYTIILLNVIIHLYQYFSPIPLLFTLIPVHILQGQNLHTLITCTFLHADFIHLLMNMYFLYVFGVTVEQELHPLLYLPLYLFAGVFGSLGHVLVTVTLEQWFYPTAALIPSLGASGAIFGVMAAFAFLKPQRRIRVWSSYGDTSRYVAGWNFIMIYFVFEVLLTLVSFGSGVAHGAHVFGFVGGYLFAQAYQRLKDARDRQQVTKEYMTPTYVS